MKMNSKKVAILMKKVDKKVLKKGTELSCIVDKTWPFASSVIRVFFKAECIGYVSYSDISNCLRLKELENYDSKFNVVVDGIEKFMIRNKEKEILIATI